MTQVPQDRPVRIANCSGFYGDLISAARDMVEGGPIDVLTGDYLAELTMLILWKARQKDPEAGYARTFLIQLEQVLGSCLDRGIKIVTNAGGLNPAGLAGQVGKIAAGLGLPARVGYVSGDDLLGRLPGLLAQGIDLAHLDTGQPLADAGVEPVSANAYLGGWGIAEALAAGADVVVCPRVTDASLVVGPAAWWHGWARTDWDRLAGAVVAGHVIECGPQACGGNYPFLDEVADRRYPGFPIAEVSADGSAVITKHPGTGGLVSAGTVTAQLLYEIAGPDYPGPDVVAHFDSVRLADLGGDRVRVSGTRGTPPPPTLKVAMNYLGGYRNTMTLVLTGLDIEEKAAWAEQELFGLLGGRDSVAQADVRLLRFDRPDAPSNEQATAHLRITVKDSDPGQVGRRFSDAVLALALGGYPGFHTTTPPTPASAYGVFWPALVPADAVQHVVVLPDGTRRVIPHSPAAASPAAGPAADVVPAAAAEANGPAIRVPLGRIVGARSGDKGGNANVGLWARDPAAFGWLRETLTVPRFRDLLPEAAGLEIRRYELPNLHALNFVVAGLLGEGVAAATRPDPQAKGLGEYLRSRYIEVPARLLGMRTAEGIRVRDPARREKILRAAAELVARRGYHSVSLADIGAAAGIVGSGIYRHFHSKSAILVALLDQVMDRLLDGAARIAASGADDARVLEALVADQVAVAVDDRYLVQLYQREVHTLPEADRRRLRRLQRHYVEEWVHVLAGLRPELTDGEARATVHASIGAIQSVASYNSGLPRAQQLALLSGIAQACLSRPQP